MKSPTMASHAPDDEVVALCYAREVSWGSAYGPKVAEIPQTILRSGCQDPWPSCGYNPRCALKMPFRGVHENEVPWPKWAVGQRPWRKTLWGSAERARQARERRRWLGQRAQEPSSSSSYSSSSSCNHGDIDLWSWEFRQPWWYGRETLTHYMEQHAITIAILCILYTKCNYISIWTIFARYIQNNRRWLAGRPGPGPGGGGWPGKCYKSMKLHTLIFSFIKACKIVFNVIGR